LKTRIISILILAGSIAFIALSYESNPILDAKKLDANNISTWFRNNGSFNYDYTNGYAGFEWPKGTNKFARFASGLWIGAKVGNDTLVAIAIEITEFLPGYTDNNGIPQGQNDPLYRLYRLTFGVNDADRMNWPNSLLGNSDQGAPVYFDNQTNSWKPLDFGHQTLFYRFTDSYPEAHVVSNGMTAPLKADVMRLDFSIDLPGCLDNASFSQFTIINRSTSTWNNAYLSIWTDDDIGDGIDDKIGCDSVRKLEYTYCSRDTDYSYGAHPPAVGFVGLRGAIMYTGNPNDTAVFCRNKIIVRLAGYRDIGLTVMRWVAKHDPLWGNPHNYRDSYRIMQGKLTDGSNIVHPNGYFTTFSHTGDPVTGQGWLMTFAEDVRFLISTGPVNMAPGDTQLIVVAQVIARGSSNLNSITTLRQLTQDVKNYYNSCYTSDCVGIEPLSNEFPVRFQLYQNYPNPFNASTKIKFDIPSNVKRETSNVKIIIYDVLGREVALLVNEKLKPGTYEVQWDAVNYPSGVYYYRLVGGDYTETKKMVLIK
jgi:type IX secretion system substrate protein